MTGGNHHEFSLPQWSVLQSDLSADPTGENPKICETIQYELDRYCGQDQSHEARKD